MVAYSWIIVGSGFTGAVLAERIASQLDQKVLVIDKRPHIGGNAYDYLGSNGTLIHKYGPHIFHTNSAMVWDYLSRFTDWTPYFHRVLGMVEGNLLPIPFNLNSIAGAFPAAMASRLTEKLIGAYGYGKKIPILKFREQEDVELNFLGDYIYDHVFKNYTLKQWGVRPEQLDAHVTARVPVFISRDDRYFQDRYQAMPTAGYSAMFEKILAHDNIGVSLNTAFSQLAATDAKVIFTGPVDEYFGYEFGALPYRSLDFRIVESRLAPTQAAATVNYPNEFNFTRITELGLFTSARPASSVLVTEYPQPYEIGRNDPYYPIPTEENARTLERYKDRIKAVYGAVFFAGRLGDYAYYNMDQACARALAMFDKEIRPLSSR